MYLDSHTHMISRTTDDYERMAAAGVVACIEPAFWLGQPRTSVDSFVDYFDSLIGWEPFRAGQFGIRPGHEAFLTLLVPCVLSFREENGRERYAAADGGVLVVEKDHVSVVTREAKDVLTVPAASFRFSPPAAAERRGFSLRDVFMPRMRMGRRGGEPRNGADASTRTLYVLKDGAPQAVEVKTGATDGEATEIVSGLSDGDQVITGIRQPRG